MEDVKTFKFNGLEFKPVKMTEAKLNYPRVCTRYEFCNNIGKYNGRFDYEDFYINCVAQGIDEKNYVFEIQNGLLKGILVTPVPNPDALAIANNLPVDIYFKVLIMELLNSKDPYFVVRTNKVEYPLCNFRINFERDLEYSNILDMDNLTITSKFADYILSEKKFSSHYELYNYLKDSVTYNEPITEDTVAEEIFKMIVEDNSINLTKQRYEYAFTYCIYYCILNDIVGKDRTYHLLKDLYWDYPKREDYKTISEFLEAIRNDILNEIRKEINTKLFDDPDFTYHKQDDLGI